jgi:hypothetical protein
VTNTVITTTAYEPLRHILENLRREDREEFNAARGPWEPHEIAKEIQGLQMLARQSYSYIAWCRDTGEPVAAWGAYAISPVSLIVWAFATPDWPRVVRAVTRHCLRIMIPALLKAGFHRAECRAIATRHDTYRWLTGLGFHAEAVLSGFGVRRENFILFAWTLDEIKTDFKESAFRM